MPLTSDSAQLRGLVSTKPCAVWPLTPPLTGVTERADGYAVSSLKSLRDRVRRIAGGDGHRRVRADQLAHAADVDDDVVADVHAPFVRERDEVRERRGCRRLVRRIELEQQLALLAEVVLERRDLAGEEIGLRSRRRRRRPRRRARRPPARAPACPRCSSRASARRRSPCSRRARPTSCLFRRVPG